jgi:uncharacterized protein (TIGR03067 family)
MRRATDLDRLQGSWRVTALEVDGQPMTSEMLAGSSIVVKGRRFTSLGMGAVYEGEVELDPEAAPCRLDMKFDAGPEKGKTNPGIYELNGDIWRLCFAMRGGVRPAAFATAAGSGFALETLMRGKASAKPPKKSGKSAPVAAPRDPRPTEFEGEWPMVSGVMDGRPMDESSVKWVKRMTRGSLTTVQAGPQVMMQFEFTADASKSPKEIDYLNTAGPHKGKRQQGIYQFDGDVLRVCVAAPGDSRPAEFQSVAGDRRTLTAWKRD